MSTSSECALCAAANAGNAGEGVVIYPDDDRAHRLAAAEAAATQAIEAARQAAANTATALRAEFEQQHRAPSRSPVRRRIP